MAEMTKKLHFLKNGTEQTAKAYSATAEAGSSYIPNKIDGVACYAPIGDINDPMATNGRVKKEETIYFKRNYYKKTVWNQPVLTSNGTIGGTSFAVTASHDTTNAFRAFDSDVASYVNQMNAGASFTFYNPEPLMVTNIVQSSSGAEYTPQAGNLQYSDDGTNWNLAITWSSSSYSVDVGYHKYWKINVTQKGTGSGNSDFSHIAITAYIEVSATEQDYDRYEEIQGTADDHTYYEVVEQTYAIKSQSKPPYAEVSYTTAGTYTFTVPAGVTRMRVAVCGGGGGGAYNYTYPYNKTSQGGTGGTSSFGSLLKATGGGGAIDKWWKSGTDSEGHPNYSNNKTAGSAGSPNGNAGSIVKGMVDVNGGTGFSLSFSKSSGSYGTGGGVYTKGLNYTNGTAPTGGSGGYNSSYVTVTTGSTYTITVGAGGSGGSYGNSSKAYGKAGKSGFVFIAYGGDI